MDYKKIKRPLSDYKRFEIDLEGNIYNIKTGLLRKPIPNLSHKKTHLHEKKGDVTVNNAHELIKAFMYLPFSHYKVRYKDNNPQNTCIDNLIVQSRELLFISVDGKTKKLYNSYRDTGLGHTIFHHVNKKKVYKGGYWYKEFIDGSEIRKQIMKEGY